MDRVAVTSSGRELGCDNFIDKGVDRGVRYASKIERAVSLRGFRPPEAAHLDTRSESQRVALGRDVKVEGFDAALVLRWIDQTPRRVDANLS